MQDNEMRPSIPRLPRLPRLPVPSGSPIVLAAAFLAAVATAVPGAAQTRPAPQPQGEVDGVYSFVGAIDGAATLFAARSGAQSELEVHLPILRGDRVWTRTRSRLAVLTSDRSILALDRDSEVTFARIAGSPDGEDADSLFVLHQGRLSLDVPPNLLNWELPAVDTTNARIHAKQDGRYQVESDGDSRTEVEVLEGFAEVVTQRGSVIVRSGEALLVHGLGDPKINLQSIDLQSGVGAAAALDEWTERRRDRLIAYASVDADGAALSGHGRWVEVDDRRAWKPNVKGAWQPYSRGRWTDTPAGLYWVARDPWGPLTYHYGSWSLHPGYGWVWYPNAIYAPSHVYWYWGPSYVGWIPRGYYQRHYRGLGFGLRFGLYGWAGGLWDPFDTWIFCPSGYLDYGRDYYDVGRSLRLRHPQLARGVITTDTNGIDYRNWRNPEAARQAILGKRSILSESELPDVTDFVARRPDLHESLRARLEGNDMEPRVTAPGSVGVSGGPVLPGRRDPGRGPVGITAGGVRSDPAPRVGESPDDELPGAGVSGGPVPSDRRGPIGITAGGVRSDPAPRVDESPVTRSPVTGSPGAGSPRTGEQAPIRATPPTDDGAFDRGRRPTPGRRVLDAIRGRDAVPTPPRTAPPQPTRPDHAAPSPGSTTPRTTTPPVRSTPPPRIRTAPPRTSNPRSTPPPRIRTAPPTTANPRSTPPPRIRTAPPRTSNPRSTPPPRTRTAPPRTSTPRSTPSPPRSAPRGEGGRTPPALR